MGREISPPTRRAAALAVIANPFADRFQDDLEILMQIGEELGRLLGDKAVAALDVDPSVIESYGKAAIVGEGGELEHARSEEHTSELQSLMRLSYAVFCLKKKNTIHTTSHKYTTHTPLT